MCTHTECYSTIRNCCQWEGRYSTIPLVRAHRNNVMMIEDGLYSIDTHLTSDRSNVGIYSEQINTFMPFNPRYVYIILLTYIIILVVPTISTICVPHPPTHHHPVTSSLLLSTNNPTVSIRWLAMPSMYPSMDLTSVLSHFLSPLLTLYISVGSSVRDNTFSFISPHSCLSPRFTPCSFCHATHCLHHLFVVWFIHIDNHWILPSPAGSSRHSPTETTDCGECLFFPPSYSHHLSLQAVQCHANSQCANCKTRETTLWRRNQEGDIECK